MNQCLEALERYAPLPNFSRVHIIQMRDLFVEAKETSAGPGCILKQEKFQRELAAIIPLVNWGDPAVFVALAQIVAAMKIKPVIASGAMEKFILEFLEAIPSMHFSEEEKGRLAETFESLLGSFHSVVKPTPGNRNSEDEKRVVRDAANLGVYAVKLYGLISGDRNDGVIQSTNGIVKCYTSRFSDDTYGSARPVAGIVKAFSKQGRSGSQMQASTLRNTCVKTISSSYNFDAINWHDALRGANPEAIAALTIFSARRCGHRI